MGDLEEIDAKNNEKQQESIENEPKENENKPKENDEQQETKEEPQEELTQENHEIDAEELAKVEVSENEGKITKISSSNSESFGGIDLGDFSPVASSETPADVSDPPTDSKSITVKKNPTERKKVTKGMSDKGARLSVTLVDTINCRLCSYIGGEDKDKYRLTKSEKKELIELLSDYLSTMEIEASPQGLLIMGFAVIMFSKYVMVAEDYSKNKKRKKSAKIEEKKNEGLGLKAETVKKEVEQKRAEEPQRPKEKEFTSISDLEEHIYDKLMRSNFEEKTNERGKYAFYTTGRFRGFYEYSVTGKRYATDTKKEHLKAKNNKPSQEVLMSFVQLKKLIGSEKEAFKKLGVIIRRVKKHSGYEK